MIRALALSLVLAGLAPAAVAQGAPAGSRPSDPRSRWNALSEEERDRYRKLFAEIQKLSPERREMVKERLRSFADARARLEQSLSPEERAALDSMDASARERWVRKAVGDRLREQQDKFSKLFSPGRRGPHFHPRSNPNDRREAMREFSEEASRAAAKWVAQMAVDRGLIDAARAAAIQEMAPAEAAREVAVLRKQMLVAKIEGDAERRAQIGESEWAELKALPAEEFLRRLEAQRALHPREPRGEEGGARSRPFLRKGPPGKPNERGAR